MSHLSSHPARTKTLEASTPYGEGAHQCAVATPNPGPSALRARSLRLALREHGDLHLQASNTATAILLTNYARSNRAEVTAGRQRHMTKSSDLRPRSGTWVR